MNKWKNYGLWLSLASLAGIILNKFGIVELGNYQHIIDLILSILVALGVISNPNVGLGYLDKGEDEK